MGSRRVARGPVRIKLLEEREGVVQDIIRAVTSVRVKHSRGYCEIASQSRTATIIMHEVHGYREVSYLNRTGFIIGVQ